MNKVQFLLLFTQQVQRSKKISKGASEWMAIHLSFFSVELGGADL